MALEPGTRLGPYEVLALIGAGGMGEVYKGRDTRLDRLVAIKTLPAHLADRPELRERFRREANTLANLKHAHICTLYDIGHQDGIDYLVMEYLEGETLAERLKKGPLPLEQVFRYAAEMADALDKAHRAGFTHRDIKPANIMLTKEGSKLLDFGLAKLKQEVAKATIPSSEMPTAPGTLTQHGTLLGTLQYMAPEQVEGKTDELDARTDVFAFGAVVYEMGTDKKAFDGKTQASVIAAILKVEPPPMSSLQPMTPPALDRVVKKCLAKDPDERWQTALDLWHELEWIKGGGTQAGKEVTVSPRRKLRERLAWGVAVLFLVSAVILAIVHFRETPPELPSTRLSVVLPEKVTLASPPLISPDGRKLAFVGRDANGQSAIWIRLLDALAAQPLPGTSGAGETIFWAPDSRFLGFFAEGKLKKIDITGGPPITLCDTGNPRGGTWNKDGVILFGGFNSGVQRVAAAGGAVTSVTTLDPSKQEGAHRFPQFLPDGDHFLLRILSGQADRDGIYLGSLSSRETRFLLATSSNAIYVPPGFLLFLRDRTLMAQPFDAGELQLVGEAFPLAEQVPQTGTLLGSYSASENGVLAYVTGSSALYHFVWVDRAGREAKVATEPVQFNPTQHFSLSPDEKRVAQDQSLFQGDIWLLELTRGTISRFTFDPAVDQAPVWSADGNRLVFSSNRGGAPALYQKAASGEGKDELLIPLTGTVGTQSGPTDWSSDGRFLLYEPQREKTKFDLFVLPLVGDRKPMPLLQSEFDEGQGKFSPDGKWVAYTSTESGRPEVYVQTFPPSGGKWQISTGGGFLPMWRRDGKELFYVAPGGGRLMSVEVKTTPQFEASVPKFLFQAPVALTHGMDPGYHYAVSADGQRFLLLLPVQETTPSPITVVLNWTAGLKK